MRSGKESRGDGDSFIIQATFAKGEIARYIVGMSQAGLFEGFFQINLNATGADARVREYLRRHSNDHTFQFFIDALLLRMIDDNYGEVVQALIDFGANVNAPNSYGATSLYAAVRTGNRVLMSVLLASGARLDIRGGAGETLADVASFFGHDELAAELVEMGVLKSETNPLRS